MSNVMFYVVVLALMFRAELAAILRALAERIKQWSSD